MRIDYVQYDDWSGIYVDGQLKYQDHAIRDDHWIELMNTTFKEGRYSSDGVLDVFKWWVDMVSNDMRYLPDTFEALKEIAGSGLEAE